MSETKCCGGIGLVGGRFECSNGAVGVLDDDHRLLVTLPGCKPFIVTDCEQQRAATFTIETAWIAMRAVNAVDAPTACSVLDVPGGFNAVKL